VAKAGTVTKKPAIRRPLSQVLHQFDYDMMRRNPQTRRRALVTGGAVRLGRAIALGPRGRRLRRRRRLPPLGGRRPARPCARAATGAGAAARRAARRSARRGPAARPSRRGGPRTPLGGLDALVNSAAGFGRTPLATATRAEWDARLDVNLRAPFFCAQAAVAPLLRGGAGHVVNVGDVWGARDAPRGLVGLRRVEGGARDADARCWPPSSAPPRQSP